MRTIVFICCNVLNFKPKRGRREWKLPAGSQLVSAELDSHEPNAWFRCFHMHVHTNTHTHTDKQHNCCWVSIRQNSLRCWCLIKKSWRHIVSQTTETRVPTCCTRHLNNWCNLPFDNSSFHMQRCACLQHIAWSKPRRTFVKQGKNANGKAPINWPWICSYMKPLIGSK